TRSPTITSSKVAGFLSFRILLSEVIWKTRAFSFPSRVTVLATLSTAPTLPLKGKALAFLGAGGVAGASADRAANGMAKTAAARTAIPNSFFIDLFRELRVQLTPRATVPHPLRPLQ